MGSRIRTRSTICISLLLICALCVPGVREVRAGDEAEGYGTVSLDVAVSEDSLSVGQEEAGDISGGETRLGDRDISGDGGGLENREADETVSMDDKVSLDETGEVSENGVSSDILMRENAVISEDRPDEETHKEALNVVLPTELPFSVILLGKEGRRGAIRSEQFCLENKGYEDICVSIQGVCAGIDAERYVVSDVSVKDAEVQEKNVWMYLKWEDKDREELEKTGIVMGDASRPGEGEVILEAPKRDKKGRIIKSDQSSKAYFSFTGDLNAGSDGAWRGDELSVDLEFSMEKLISVDADDRAEKGSVSSDRSDDPGYQAVNELDSMDPDDGEDVDDLESISDNTVGELKSVSDNTIDGPENLSDNLLGDPESVSGNTMDDLESISKNVLDELLSISDGDSGKMDIKEDETSGSGEDCFSDERP